MYVQLYASLWTDFTFLHVLLLAMFLFFIYFFFFWRTTPDDSCVQNVVQHTVRRCREDSFKV